jgi:protein-L-isoaspartate(D-aspartate) O-methyltransferase
MEHPAFKIIHRVDFLRPSEQSMAHENRALPIGFEQTNSQPAVVDLMLKLLDPQPGDRILDIGSGSGWTTALLAHIVGPTGQVIGLELVPELVKFGNQNLRKYGFKNAQILQATPNTIGLPKEPAFDRVLVSAAADKLPKELLSQFKKRLVIPIRNSIWMYGPDTKKEYTGFSFVPLL